MSVIYSDNLEEPDDIDKLLISLNQDPTVPLYFYMFLIAMPTLFFEYLFMLNKLHIFLEWAHQL